MKINLLALLLLVGISTSYAQIYFQEDSAQFRFSHLIAISERCFPNTVVAVWSPSPPIPPKPSRPLGCAVALAGSSLLLCRRVQDSPIELLYMTDSDLYLADPSAPGRD